MEAILVTGAIFLLPKSRNIKKQKLINEGATKNSKKGDKPMDFVYIL